MSTRIKETHRMDRFLDAINIRFDFIKDKIKVNEFSGKDINSLRSIVLQIAQNDLLTLLQKKCICIDILVALEEVTK